MKKKTYQLGVRMDEDLLARLRRFEEQTGISSSALARATLESALDYFESEKEIVFPLRCVPRKSVIPPPHFVNFFRVPAGKVLAHGLTRKNTDFSPAEDVLGAETSVSPRSDFCRWQK